MGYAILGDFEGNAQEPTTRFNIQPATQPTEFSDFQLNEASSCNQHTVAPSDFSTVFCHEPAIHFSYTDSVSS
jgi:hypothetical protein